MGNSIYLFLQVESASIKLFRKQFELGRATDAIHDKHVGGGCGVTHWVRCRDNHLIVTNSTQIQNRKFLRENWWSRLR